MNSKITNLYLKSKKTNDILHEILNTITISSTIDKYKKLDRQPKRTISTQPSYNIDNFPSLKEIDFLTSEIIQESMGYHNLSKLIPSVTSELKINSENINKSGILDKLGIFNDGDKSNILANMNLPLLYFIIFYFIQSINQNYQNIINFFNDVKDNLISKSEELLSQNIIKKYSQKKLVVMVFPTINSQQETTVASEKNYNFENFKENNKLNLSDNNIEQDKIQALEDISPVKKKGSIRLNKGPKNTDKHVSFARRKSVAASKFTEFRANLFKTLEIEDNFANLEDCPYIEQQNIY